MSMNDLFGRDAKSDRDAALARVTQRGGSSPVDSVPKDVLDLFEKLALQVRKGGIKRYSADAIIHRIRWEMNVERGIHDFKCNNNWTAPLARWFLKRHPECDGFFELRSSPPDKDKAVLTSDDVEITGPPMRRTNPIKSYDPEDDYADRAEWKSGT